MPDTQTNTPMSSAVSSIPATGDVSSDSLFKKLGSREDEYNTEVKGLAKQVGDTKLPEPPKLTQAPDQKDFNRSPMEAFGSAAMVLSAFGGLLTKHPMQTALNSGAGVLNAYHQQDTAAFQKAMEKWKADTDNAWKMANWQNELYKDMINKPESEARILAAGMKNDVALAALQSKTLRDAARTTASATKHLNTTMIKQEEYERRIASGEDQRQAFDEIFNTSASKAEDKKRDEKQAAEFDFTKAKPNDVVPGTGLSVKTVQQLGDAIHKGATPSSLGLGYSMNPVKKAVDNYVSNKYPDFDMAKAQLDYSGAKREEAALATRSAPVKAAINEIDTLSDPMVDAIKKLNPSDYPDINSVLNAYSKKTGGPEIVAAAEAVQAFQQAVVGLMIKNGVSTDTAREEGKNLINVNFALDQVEGYRDQAKITAAKVFEALDRTKKQIGESSSAPSNKKNGLVGKPPDEKHIKMLQDDNSEENRKYFDEAFGDGAAAKALEK